MDEITLKQKEKFENIWGPEGDYRQETRIIFVARKGR